MYLFFHLFTIYATKQNSERIQVKGALGSLFDDIFYFERFHQTKTNLMNRKQMGRFFAHRHQRSQSSQLFIVSELYFVINPKTLTQSFSKQTEHSSVCRGMKLFFQLVFQKVILKQITQTISNNIRLLKLTHWLSTVLLLAPFISAFFNPVSCFTKSSSLTRFDSVDTVSVS